MGWELLNERAMELWLEIIGMAVSEDGVGIEIVGLRLARPSPHLISSSSSKESDGRSGVPTKRLLG